MAEKSKIHRPRFGLRSLLLLTVGFGAAVGLSVKSVIDYMNRPTPFELAEQREQELYTEFTTTNPRSLDGWQVKRRPDDQSTLSWAKNGILYLDRNGDGKPDTKRREWPVISTTKVWWEDTNFDGRFDTEREQGCFHDVNRALNPPVCVPFLAS